MHAMVDGLRVSYTDEGQGIPLLLVHGFPLDRGVWQKQVDAFKHSYRVIAPDLRGFGESKASTGAVSMSCFAKDLYGLLQHLGCGPVILVGHSMGGYVALAFAKAYPKLLRGLVLVGTKAGADAPEVAATRRSTAERVRAHGCSLVVDAMAPKMLAPGNTDLAMAASVRGFMSTATTEGVIGALQGMAERPDAAHWLGLTRVPTLVVVGAEDTIIPPGESETLARITPGAQLKVISHAGHLVAFEQPDAFNSVLKDWLGWGSTLKTLVKFGEGAKTMPPERPNAPRVAEFPSGGLAPSWAQPILRAAAWMIQRRDSPSVKALQPGSQATTDLPSLNNESR